MGHTVALLGRPLYPRLESSFCRMADAAIITTDMAESAYVAQARSLVGKRGRVVATAIAHPADTTRAAFGGRGLP